MNYKSIFTFLLLGVVCNVTAQTYDYYADWSHGAGTYGSLDAGEDISVDDQSQSVYFLGSKESGTDLDPSTNNTWTGPYGPGFIAKYTFDGQFIWGSSISNLAYASSMDRYQGNVYITGSSGTYNNYGSVVLSKYDTSGNEITTYQMGNSECSGMDIVVTDSGYVYVGGIFKGSVDFDPGGSGSTLYSNDGNMFIAKYDTNMSLIWVQEIAVSGISYNLNGLGTDRNGNLYAAGKFSGTIDLDPNPSNTLTYTFPLANTTLTGRAFVAKYNPNGSIIWGHQLRQNGSLESSIQSVGVDRSGNFYIGGEFESITDFDLGIDTVNYDGGAANAFVAKYTNQAELKWVKTSGNGNSGGYEINEIRISENDSIIHIGGYSAPSSSYLMGYSFYETTNGFLITSDSSGVSLNGHYVEHSDACNISKVNAVAGLNSTDVIATGEFSCDEPIYLGSFNKSSHEYSANSLSDYNLFLAKYGFCPLTNINSKIPSDAQLSTNGDYHKTVCEGDSVALGVTSLEGADITYDWDFRGNPLPSATDSIIIIDSATSANAGLYDLTVRGKCSNDYLDLKLFVIDEISIYDTLTETITACEGQNPQFNVGIYKPSTSEFDTLQTVWYKEATPLDTQLDANTSSYHSSTYNLNTISHSDSGEYSVKVSLLNNPCNNAPIYSDTTQLNVKQYPHFTNDPVMDTSICPGDTFRLEVGVAGSNLTYSWFDDNYHNYPDYTSNQPYWEFVVNENDHEGNWDVEVTDSVCGITISDTANKIIDVITPPTSQGPTNIHQLSSWSSAEFCQGDSITIDADLILNEPKTEVQWYHNGNLLTNKNGEIIHFPSLTTSDSGKYQPKVVQPCTSYFIDPVVIDVNPEPQVVQHTQSPLNACPDDTLEITYELNAHHSNFDISYNSCQWDYPSGASGTQAYHEIKQGNKLKIIIYDLPIPTDRLYYCHFSGCNGWLTTPKIRVDSDVDDSYTQITDSACVGDSIFFNGTWYKENTQIVNYYTNRFGCDSNVTRVFTFHQPEPTIVLDSPKLRVPKSYQSYQWYMNGTVIDGAQQSTFELQDTGTYKVMVTSKKGCTGQASYEYYPQDEDDQDDTTSTSIYAGGNTALPIQAYPNPANDFLHIDIKEQNEVVKLKLFGTKGEIVKEKEIEQGTAQTKLDVKSLNSGIYFLSVYAEDGRIASQRVIINPTSY